MILLDSDHFSVLPFHESDRRNRLVSRLAAHPDELIGTTIVNADEQLRGWLASIKKERHAIRQVEPYAQLSRLLDFLAEYHIAPFDERAANHYDTIRNLRVGTMDLKTASIAIVQNALLLIANKRDFEKVPGLRFENWLD